MKVLRWIVICLGGIGVLLGLMAWIGGADIGTFLEFAFFSVLLVFFGLRIGKPGAAPSKSEPDHDWGSALDRD